MQTERRSLNNYSSTGKRLFHGDFEQWNMEHEAYAKTVNTASFMH